MNGFSLSALGAHCSAIAHSANSSASELADLLRTIPDGQHAQQLAALSEALFAFSTSAGQFEGALQRATTLSPRLQQLLDGSLQECHIKIAPIGKQVMRLDAPTVPMMNTMFLTVHMDLLVTYAQLLGFYEEVLAMPERDDQDAVLDGPAGRRIIEQAGDAGKMLAKAGEIIVNSAEDEAPAYADPPPLQPMTVLEGKQAMLPEPAAPSHRPAPDLTDLPPPYEAATSTTPYLGTNAAASSGATSPVDTPLTTSRSASIAESSHSLGRRSSSFAGPVLPIRPGQASGSNSRSNSWVLPITKSFKALTAGIWAKPDPLVNALCEASRRGDTAQMAALLQQGTNIDGKNDRGETALHCAIVENHAKAARLLFTLGASDNIWSKMPPMFLAASLGNLDVAQMIYQRGGSAADVKKFSMSGQSYFVDVVSSGNLAGVRFLLEKGANARAQSNSGRPAVVIAARKCNIEMVRLLLNFGAKVTSDDLSGNSMVGIALDKDNLELLDLLLERGAMLGGRTTSGDRVLAAAVARRNVPFALRMLENGADGNSEDLMGQKVIVSVIKDQKLGEEDKCALVRALLKNGAKTTASDLVWHQAHLLELALTKGASSRIGRLILEAGADVTRRIGDGETPLTYAIARDWTDWVRELLEHGADPDAADKHAKTPLLQSLMKGDNLDMARLLIAHGADTDLPSGSARAFALSLGRADVMELVGLKPSSSSPRAHSPPLSSAVHTGKDMWR
ncbi:putative ankyrin repeat protein-like protein [Emericellopsis cladophorae]|uniref:Ankyrin repeat protein-like protein n=1 Tax=Emericellopsis cladophorae TaxID=2686198 RepID=A0A9P9Y4K8_9HYPO|nr:putative ankyrin repeat protein-like protein [Emericellopsis cladophorae]KAI6782834.1 putative ankyrin repeat protein-like protein [Emericellopsis cladophorae]